MIMKRTITSFGIIQTIIAVCFTTLSYAQPIQNGGFETWQTTAGVEKPTGWTISDAAGLGCNRPTSIKTTDKAEGSFAIMLESAFCANAGGVHEGFAFLNGTTTAKPDSLKFKYKSTFSGTDSASIKVTFNNGQTVVGTGAFYIKATQTTYKQISIPITYTGNPDKMTIFLSSDGISNPTDGNRIWVDDLKFANKGTGVSVGNIFKGINEFSCYPVPMGDILNVNLNLKEASAARITLCDVTGRMLIAEDVVFNQGDQVHVLNTSSLNRGTYLCTLQLANGEKMTRRIVR